MARERTYGFNKSDAEALIQSIGTSQTTFAEVRPRGGRNEYLVILDATLAVASNSKTGATSCLATVCELDESTDNLIETSEQITVWNHSETTSHAEDTFGVARNIGKKKRHFVFFGDCAAMASR